MAKPTFPGRFCPLHNDRSVNETVVRNMKYWAFLALAFAVMIQLGFTKDKQPFSPQTQELLKLLDKKETSMEMEQFVKKRRLQRTFAKGDLSFENEQTGVTVLFREAKVWRVVLNVKGFEGELPYGVKRNLSPRAFFKEYGSLLEREYPKGPEPWFVSKQDGFQFVFLFDKDEKLRAVFVQKDAGPDRI